MKFKMRYADQLVGILIVAALVSLIVVIFLLGSTQRWFSVKHDYKTYATTASGLSRNMAVNFRGVVIGNVKSFDLMDDNRIEVIFTIHDEYQGRIKEGSLVDVQESPIGLGAKFIFYSGMGETVLQDGDLVPLIGSDEARSLIARGLTDIPPKDDFIADLVDKVGAIFEELQITMEGLNVGPRDKAVTALGQVIANVQELTANFTDDMANPNGVRRIINGSGGEVEALEATLVSLAGTLDHVERSLAYLPREMPQIIDLLSKARTAVASAEDVLISLKNNPLLRGGIPEHAEIDSSGTNPRSISF